MATETITQEVLTDLTSILNEVPEGMEEAEAIVEGEDNGFNEIEQNIDDIEDDLELGEAEEPEEVAEDQDEFEETEEAEDEEAEDDGLLGEEYLDDAYVDIDGESVSLRELKRGFLRQSDYTAKTTSLAEQRKEVELATSTAKAEADARIQDRFQMVAMDVEKRLTQFNEVDWATLARSNPNDYTALKAEYDVTVNEARTLESEYNKLKTEQAAVTATKNAEIAKQSFSVLSEAIPNWGKEAYTDLVSYATTNGMSQDQIGGIVDAPTLLMMHKAYMFDKGKTEIKNKVTPKAKSSVKSKIKNKSTKVPSTTQRSTKRVNNIKTRLKSAPSKNERNKLSAALVAEMLDD